MNKEIFIRTMFRNLPIPGRYLNVAITFLNCNLSRIAVPNICTDRWNQFRVRIVNPSDIIQKQIYFQGYFEYRESAFIRNTLRPGQTFLDIGANIGWHTLLAAKKVGPSGRVIAFEPVASTYAQLTANVSINKLTNVELHRVALGNRSGSATIFECEDRNCGANSLYSPDSTTQGEQVTVRTGDAYIETRNIDEIDLCKVDVEGAEFDVIDGLKHALSSRKIRKLLIEVNDEALRRAGRSGEELLSRLRSYGFRLQDLRTSREVLHTIDITHGQNVVAVLD